MGTGGFSSKRLVRLRDLLERRVQSGFVPGAVVALARHGTVHIEATGSLAFEGAGSRTPMASDTICRLGSMTKPIVAACAMTLVEDCTLRLDDPVDDLLPELAEMTVLADPNGPLDDVVSAIRPITLRDLCRDPVDRERHLECAPLLVLRASDSLILPDEALPLQRDDEILFAGRPAARRAQRSVLLNLNVRDYAVRGIDLPGGWVWQRLTRRAPTSPAMRA